MDALTSLTESSSVAPVQSIPNIADSAENQQSGGTGQADGATDEFSKFLMQSLDRTGQDQVNEEELFSAIISQRLSADNPEAAKVYQEQFQTLSQSMARPDGYVPVEDVAKAALKATVAAGKITSEEADKINGTAFRAAQLDDNLECLYDGRGETSAIANMEEAMFKVRAIIDQVEAGTMPIEARSLDIPSNQGFTPGNLLMHLGEANANGILGASGEALGEAGKEAEGVEGEAAVEGEGSEKQVRFTWKHEASDGNLAILLPTRLNGNIDGVSLYDSEGNLLEKGSYSKQTGDKRAVFRFDEPGGSYGKDVDAVVYLEDGSTLTYHVDNGGKRTYVPQDDGKKRSKSELEDYLASQRGESPSTSSGASSAVASNSGTSSSDAGSSSSDTGSSSSDAGSASSSDSSSSSGSSGGSSGGSDSGSGESSGGGSATT